MSPVRKTAEPDARFDIGIIGGGIIGLFAAVTLARHGYSVAVIDQGELWSEASAVNAGSLGVQNKLSALVPYSLWSWEIWQDLAKDLGIDAGVNRQGGYKVAMTEPEAERLHEVAQEQIGLGLTAELLTRQQIADRAPWLSAEVQAAAFSPDDGYASPTLMGPALLRAADKLGVRLYARTRVTGVEPGKTVELTSTAGTFAVGQLALATGAWTQKAAALLGAHLPVSIDVNMVSVTEPAPPTIKGLVSHARGILTLKQVANGSCLVGGGWQGIGTLDDRRKDVDHDQLVHNLKLALRVVPGLGRLNVLRSWAGYEGVTPDSLPYIGHIGSNPNIFVAACARGGFTLGPAIGRLLAELMTTGKTSRPIGIFDPSRFEHA